MMRSWLFALLFIPFIAHAAIEATQFDDPDKEARYKQLIAELRCLVCQNQNLADSNAELAQDMRHKTYELVKGGATNDDVVNYMVKRYGDFVLYRPPFKLSTLLLWLGPFVILAGGVVILIVIIRRRAKQPNAGMSDSDLKRAKVLLGEEDNN
ncbi:MAG: cytochrome c-type biogenesis protein CcmH [Sedimenticola sp.]|uniref:Cytochrome c-type biogenesis protein n=1 Tax=Sedimenticola thiotaurini TaxID=1543721 RepID=A0A558DGI4_9GAMM|nr:cytochrome c-type biogenesis protein CcmH [Sedimenticola sp.]MCW8974076.1 cytochrome c-type biogenesis protein CcmH [Sedimenticola sp.]MDF1527872.1 cytochrome c-type biogenesis protein CcmH [Sedimenticola sp.]TVT60137.1 MAG: cytochrome c-type biogenesis protein CcmH [Sedimenticola thiotaurini]